MRKTKEICRLTHAGLSGRAVARVLGVSNSTVSEANSRLNAAGLVWPDVEPMSEPALEHRLYLDDHQSAPAAREPDLGTCAH